MPNIPQKSKAWVLPKSGKADVFKLETKSTRTVSKTEVGIQVHFSGLNFADILMRQGLYPDAPAYPFVPGYEISGVINSLGAEVKGLSLGEKVCAGIAFGGYASQVVLPRWQVMKVPESVGLDQAAGIPVSAITAYNILFELGRVRAGDRVLVDCASGALGQMISAMLEGQGVKLLGLTSSEEKKQWLLANGIQAMTHDEFCEGHEGNFQLIINSLGGAWVKKHYERLAPLGRIVCIGAADAIAPGKRNLLKALKTVIQFPRFKVVDLMNANKGVMGLNVLRLLERPELLKSQLEEIQNMQLNSHIDRIFSYQHLNLAQDYLERRQSRGKVLLDWRY